LSKSILIDFETFFDDSYNLKGSTHAAYISNPRFEILAIGIIFPDETATPITLVGPRSVEYGLYRLQERAKEGYTFIAHNAAFDLSILALKASIRPMRSLCTLSMARAIWPKQHNDLATLAIRLGLDKTLGPKGDTSEFKDMSFRQGLYQPDTETIRKLEAYLTQDLRLGAAIYQKLLPFTPSKEQELISHTLRLATQPVLEFDTDKARKLIVDMGQAQIKAIDGIPPKIAKDSGFNELLTTALKAARDNPEAYKKSGKLGPLWAMSKKDSQRELLVNHPDPYVRKLMEAKTALDSWPLHIGRVRKLLDTAEAWGGKLVVPTKYYGAHTGRWSGEEGINLLNLPKRGGGLITGIRDCLRAPDGYKLVILDYASIEARGVAWLAGQDDMVAAFREGRDLYSEFISPAAGFTVKNDKSDPKMVWWRDAGKVTVLGAGYGAGKDAIFRQASGKYTLELCDDMINRYRSTYPKIPRMWYDLEKAVRIAIRGKPTEYGPLRIGPTRRGDRIQIRLPSGRCLYYIARETAQGVETQEWGVWAWQQPGYFAENVVQAMSRDLLTDALLKCESRQASEYGWPIAFTCYDELMSCVPENEAKLAFAEISRIMALGSAWAVGWPIAVEGRIASTYGQN
jgi:DNA polymerase bacteriophage-type